MLVVDAGRQDEVVAGASPRPAELALIVPTLNEQENVPILLERLHDALALVRWEIVFVDDDSSDETLRRIREVAQRDARVRCIHRIGRRGLASACIEGVLSTSAPYVAVLDADLQHDERLLPRMLETLKRGDLDLVVGSRYVAGGRVAGLSSRRARLSALATRLSRLLVRSDIADPMSGFFMVRREVFVAAARRMSGQGFKVLLDLLASSPRPLALGELPYEFRPRASGESKLDALVVWEYVGLLVDKLVGRFVPFRLVMFVAVGAIGLVVHLSVLWGLLTIARAGFETAQILATATAMVGNFLLNNLFTYRDRRLRGLRLLTGLASFCAICAVGAVANVGAASIIYGAQHPWWIAGLAGAVVGAVWNFSVTAALTWRRA